MCCIQQARHKCCRCIFKAMMVSYHPPHYRDEAAFQLCSSSRWAISLNPSCLPIASRWENIKVRREKKAQRECVHVSLWENGVTHPLLTAVEKILRYKTDFLFMIDPQEGFVCKMVSCKNTTLLIHQKPTCDIFIEINILLFCITD